MDERVKEQFCRELLAGRAEAWRRLRLEFWILWCTRTTSPSLPPPILQMCVFFFLFSTFQRKGTGRPDPWLGP